MPGPISESYAGPLDTSNTVLTCVYCGHKYPKGTPAAKHKLLTAHIARCKAHPMRAVIIQRDKLLEALEMIDAAFDDLKLDVADYHDDRERAKGLKEISENLATIQNVAKTAILDFQE
jgi:hypothetical protein